MNRSPKFTFIIDILEFNNKISVKEGNTIEDSMNETFIKTSWRFTLSRHSDPDIELTGHYWEMSNLEKIGELK